MDIVLSKNFEPGAELFSLYNEESSEINRTLLAISSRFVYRIDISILPELQI
jgi:hypothetical protein